MKKPARLKESLLLLVMVVMGSSSLDPALAIDPLTQAIDFAAATNEAAAESQVRIDALDEQARLLLEEYRSLLLRSNSQEVYREQLKDIICSQEKEMKALGRQIIDIEMTQRGIMPLMQRMIDALENFIALDLPFLLQERTGRIQRLRDIMKQPDLSIAERYRRILEAYQVEVDYGRTIEAYRGELEIDRVKRVVDFLRLGRTALYYHSLDGHESGCWDPALRMWAVLPSQYRRSIKQGLRIARKQAPPELLELAIPAPERETPGEEK
jgi:hypothetical protein